MGGGGRSCTSSDGADGGLLLQSIFLRKQEGEQGRRLGAFLWGLGAERGFPLDTLAELIILQPSSQPGAGSPKCSAITA